MRVPCTPAAALLYGKGKKGFTVNLDFRFIRRDELCRILGGISRSKLERDVAAGLLPSPYRLGSRAVGWRSDEIEDFLKKLEPVKNPYKSRLRKRQ